MTHIKKADMAPELQTIGTLVRPLLGHMNGKSFRRTQKFLTKTAKGRLPNDLAVEQRYIARPDGSRLRLLVVLPQQATATATAVLWLHGGGYAIEVPELELGYARKIQQAINAVVVMPDYRLSTEAPFPAALDDAYLALKWLHDHAAALGADPQQLFVAGDSAGGGLTAAVSLYARDQGEIPIAFQMPFYPMLDDRPTPTSKANDAPVWNTNNNVAAWREYLGDTPKNQVSPYAAPARATDYRGLPPTYTFVGTIEPFYYETMLYIKQLQDAGVKADIDIYDGAFHAFDQFAGKTKIAKTATTKWQQALRYAQKHYFTNQQ